MTQTRKGNRSFSQPVLVVRMSGQAKQVFALFRAYCQAKGNVSLGGLR